MKIPFIFKLIKRKIMPHITIHDSKICADIEFDTTKFDGEYLDMIESLFRKNGIVFNCGCSKGKTYWHIDEYTKGPMRISYWRKSRKQYGVKNKKDDCRLPEENCKKALTTDLVDITGKIYGRRVYSKVVGLLYSDGHVMPLEREDKNIENDVRNIPSILSIAIAENDAENIRLLSMRVLELMTRLSNFWSQIGCPKLPEGCVFNQEKVDRSQYPSYTRQIRP